MYVDYDSSMNSRNTNIKKKNYMHVYMLCILLLVYSNLVCCHVSTTSLMPLSMLNSLLADVTISEMVSA